MLLSTVQDTRPDIYRVLIVIQSPPQGETTHLQPRRAPFGARLGVRFVFLSRTVIWQLSRILVIR